MKSLLITFEGNVDAYNMNKQLNSIRETVDYDHIKASDYDDIDIIMESAHKEYQSVIILHENTEIDRFDINVRKEYKSLYESIEVIPEQFHRLNEGLVSNTFGAIGSGLGTAKRTAQNAITGIKDFSRGVVQDFRNAPGQFTQKYQQGQQQQQPSAPSATPDQTSTQQASDSQQQTATAATSQSTEGQQEAASIGPATQSLIKGLQSMMKAGVGRGHLTEAASRNHWAPLSNFIKNPTYENLKVMVEFAKDPKSGIGPKSKAKLKALVNAAGKELRQQQKSNEQPVDLLVSVQKKIASLSKTRLGESFLREAETSQSVNKNKTDTTLGNEASEFMKYITEFGKQPDYESYPLAVQALEKLKTYKYKGKDVLGTEGKSLVKDISELMTKLAPTYQNPNSVPPVVQKAAADPDHIKVIKDIQDGEKGIPETEDEKTKDAITEGGFVIIPFNPPVGDDLPNIITSFISEYDRPSTYVPLIYQPRGFKEKCWASSVHLVTGRFKGAAGDSLKGAYLISDLSLLTDMIINIQEATAGKPIKVLHPNGAEWTGQLQTEMTALQNNLSKQGSQVHIELTSYPSPKATDTEIGAKAYNLGMEIMKDVMSGKIIYKAEDQQSKQAEEWMNNETDSGTADKNPKFNHRKFLMDCLSQIYKSNEAYNKQRYEKDDSDKWHQFKKRTWDQLGFGDTLKQVQQNTDQLGGGLFLDAIKIATDTAKTAVEKEDKEKEQGTENKEFQIVIHPKWNDFVECFPKDSSLYQPKKDDGEDIKIRLDPDQKDDSTDKDSSGDKGSLTESNLDFEELNFLNKMRLYEEENPTNNSTPAQNPDNELQNRTNTANQDIQNGIKTWVSSKKDYIGFILISSFIDSNKKGQASNMILAFAYKDNQGQKFYQYINPDSQLMMASFKKGSYEDPDKNHCCFVKSDNSIFEMLRRESSKAYPEKDMDSFLKGFRENNEKRFNYLYKNLEWVYSGMIKTQGSGSYNFG